MVTRIGPSLVFLQGAVFLLFKGGTWMDIESDIIIQKLRARLKATLKETDYYEGIIKKGFIIS